MSNSNEAWLNELSRHRIAEVRPKRSRNRYPRLYGKNAKKSEHGYGGEFIIFEVVTDQGASGWGLIGLPVPGNGIHAVKGAAIPTSEHLIGRSLTELFNPQIGVISEEAIHLDFALHDLAGRILGVSVAEMMGGGGKPNVPCYDGAVYFEDISPGPINRGIDIILENCRSDYAAGYRAFKLKIGRGFQWMDTEEGMKRDIELTTAVRKLFPDCGIMVDANDGYTVDGFIQYFDAVADCRLFWIEEPFRENREDLLKLREHIAKKSPATLIADGESRPDVEQLFELAGEKLVDVLLMDIQYYGFTAWRQLMPRVLQANVQISPHNWGLRLKTNYSAQFAAGCAGVITIEGVPDDTEGIDFSGYKLDNGILHVANKPGFGMDLIWGLDLKL
jgi:D-galactarolactone cycloisomerase